MIQPAGMVHFSTYAVSSKVLFGTRGVERDAKKINETIRTLGAARNRSTPSTKD
jgi:hypothetical protein